MSNWHYPNDSIVRFRGQSAQNNDSVNRDRSELPFGGSVNLYRRTENEQEVPNGIYSCKINDSTTRQEIQVGIYHSGEGISNTLYCLDMKCIIIYKF